MADEDVKIRIDAVGAKETAKSIQDITDAMVAATKASQTHQKRVQDLTTSMVAATKASQDHQAIQKAMVATSQMQNGTMAGLVDSLKNLQSGFQEGMATGGGFNGVLGLMSAGMSGLATPIGLIVTGLGAYVAALQHSVSVSMQMYEEMRSLTAITGQSIEETESIVDSFALAGVESGRLTAAFFRLGSEIEGGGKTLEKFGISVQDSAGEMKTEGQVLIELRDRLSDVASSSERNTALMQIFGRAGRALAPVFAKSREEFAKYVETAERHQQVTELLMEQGRKYHEVLTELGFVWQELNAGFAQSQGFPALTSLAEGLLAVVNAYLKFKEFEEDIRSLVVGLFAKPFGGKTSTVGEMKVAEEEVRVQDRLMKQAMLVAKQKKDMEEGRLTPLGAQRAEQELQTAQTLQRTQMAGDAKMAGERLKLDQELQQSRLALTADRVKAETDSETAVVNVQRRGLAEAAALQARGTSERRADLEARTQMAVDQHDKELALLKRATPAGQEEDRDKRLKIDTDYTVKTAELAQERRDIDQAETRDRAVNASKQAAIAFQATQAPLQDLKKAVDQRLQVVKASSEQEALLIENSKQRQLAVLDMSYKDDLTKITERAAIERDSIARTRDEKLKTIDQEVAALTRQREAAGGNVAMQREIDQKIVGLGTERVRAETTADNQIVAARKTMVDQLKQEADREASLGETLTQKAIANLKERGQTRVSQEGIEAEIGRIQAKGATAFAELAGGGGTSIKGLEEAMSTRGMFADLTRAGRATADVLAMMAARGQAAFGGRPFTGLTAPMPGLTAPPPGNTAGIPGSGTQALQNPELAYLRSITGQSGGLQVEDDRLLKGLTAEINKLGGLMGGPAGMPGISAVAPAGSGGFGGTDSWQTYQARLNLEQLGGGSGRQMPGGIRDVGAFDPGGIDSLATYQARLELAMAREEQASREPKKGPLTPEGQALLAGKQAAAREQQEQARAQLASFSETGATAGMLPPEAEARLGGKMQEVETAGNAAITKIIDAMPDVFTPLFERFADDLVRRLEQDAART
jgi:hypothetical protein